MGLFSPVRQMYETKAYTSPDEMAARRAAANDNKLIQKAREYGNTIQTVALKLFLVNQGNQLLEMAGLGVMPKLTEITSYLALTTAALTLEGVVDAGAEVMAVMGIGYKGKKPPEVAAERAPSDDPGTPHAHAM